MKRWGALMAVVFWVTVPRASQAISVDVGGLVKASARGVRYDPGDVRAVQDSSDDLESTAGFRLTSRTQLSDALSLEVDYELIREGGEVTKRYSDLEGGGLSIPGRGGGDSDRFRWFDLTSEIDSSSYHTTTHRLDRLSLNWELRQADIRIGRQAVTWGGGLLFNPMDLVNPFSPTDTLRDYKTGDDLASLRYTHGGGYELQVIARPGRNAVSGEVTSEASTVASKLHGIYGTLEADILVARNRGYGVSGVGVSGYAGDAAWRYDLVVSDENDGTLSTVANMDLSWVAWNKNWYGLLEFYHNGYGTTDYGDALTDEASLDRLARGEVFTLGKNYVATRLQVEVHPLVNLAMTAITNIDDPSGLLQPTLVWDARDNVRLDAGALIPWGGGETEYGGFSLPDGNSLASACEITLRGTWFF
ncbi:hypothetical protein DSLASN_38960 [Desulfoluna limicola]|uniref:Alginate export domain-containing protein n=1 Tax=Desulfoluna limicola TaxID=2810562 RepID=A0ABM7PLY3_9BACT|nr:hypothetical protein [Desulfoluna limicola]BCS98264.1 hypothetical protein DSLASN_38960 [Desulfoluna limicola]